MPTAPTANETTQVCLSPVTCSTFRFCTQQVLQFEKEIILLCQICTFSCSEPFFDARLFLDFAAVSPAVWWVELKARSPPLCDRYFVLQGPVFSPFPHWLLLNNNFLRFSHSCVEKFVWRFFFRLLVNNSLRKNCCPPGVQIFFKMISASIPWVPAHSSPLTRVRCGGPRNSDLCRVLQVWGCGWERSPKKKVQSLAKSVLQKDFFCNSKLRKNN